MKKSRREKWNPIEINGDSYSLINFDHPEIESLVMDEMDTGFDVYYDTRWKITTHFASWLTEHSKLIKNQNILIIGAGAGLETLILAKQAKKIVINDLSPVSLELCKNQLEENGLQNFELCQGDYTQIDLPAECTTAVACFSIYCPATAKAVTDFLGRFDGDVIIANEYLKAFNLFLNQPGEEYETLHEWDGGVAIRFQRATKS